MSSQRHLVLGLFFVFVFGVLGWFTLFKSDFSLFSERHHLSVHFDDAGGLRTGDSVLVAGMRWGRVEAMTFDPSADRARRITVDLTLDRPVELHADARVTIHDATVLGGTVLEVEPGTPGSGPMPAGPLYGEVALNVMDALSGVISDNRESLASLLANLEEVSTDLRDGDGLLSKLLYDPQLAETLDKAVETIAATFENAEQLTEALTGEERGTIGRLIYEDEVYRQIQTLADDLSALVEEGRALMTEAREGEGAVAALLSDPEVGQRVRDIADRIAEITRAIDEGEGTIGKLVNDPEVADRLESLMTKLDEGEGSLGRLLSDAELYENLRQASADLAEATEALSEERGTLGKLIHGDEVYVELERAVRTLVGSLEEAREAAPISTFLNTVFLGF